MCIRTTISSLAFCLLALGAATARADAPQASADFYASVRNRIEASLDLLALSDDPESRRKVAARLNPKAAKAGKKKKDDKPKAVDLGAANEVKYYQYKQRGRCTEANISIQDFIVAGKSQKFKIVVASTYPAQGWLMREQGNAIEFAKDEFGSDKTNFKATINRPFMPNYVLNLLIFRDETICTDMFKLFVETTTQSK